MKSVYFYDITVKWHKNTPETYYKNVSKKYNNQATINLQQTKKPSHSIRLQFDKRILKSLVVKYSRSNTHHDVLFASILTVSEKEGKPLDGILKSWEMIKEMI